MLSRATSDSERRARSKLLVIREVWRAVEKIVDIHNGKEISNDIARKLLAEALAADESEVKLRQSYAAKLEKVLPAKKVARYLQIEMKIRAIVKFELASGIPLVS